MDGLQKRPKHWNPTADKRNIKGKSRYASHIYHFLFYFSVLLFVAICNLFIVVCTPTLYVICNFHPAASQAQSLGTAPPQAATNEKVLQWKKEDVAKWLKDIGFAV